MEENMNLDHGLQYDFIDFMGVGAQHEDDEISPVEHELDPEQENMNLHRGSQHSFIDFMGLGAQHDDNIDDPQVLICNLLSTITAFIAITIFDFVKLARL